MERLDSFFQTLTGPAQELAPIGFRKMTALDSAELPPVRLAESSRHRSRFECFDFYKPISRNLPSAMHNAASRRSQSKDAAGPALSMETAPADGEVFLLFACCVPVEGARRSAICDLQREVIQLIPNGLYEILKKHRGKPLGAIKEAFGHRYDCEIDEYFDFLVARELGFWCDESFNFPELDLGWDPPDRITNAIIDVDEESSHDFAVILQDLDDLGCMGLQVRFFSGGEMDALREVALAAEGTGIRALELTVPFHKESSEAALHSLCREFSRISRIIVHSALEDGNSVTLEGRVPVLYRVTAVDSPRCCGVVGYNHFAVNIDAFTEATSFNSCINRKISVDARGEIKNCPSMERSFGNVRDTSLHGALAQAGFKDLWSINKDQIEICRDCEFRYVCTDCRAYIERPDDRFSKPSKCTYDPYTAEWR
jgi:SPASM domain peptide maturase of grasp-with-spasm system